MPITSIGALAPIYDRLIAPLERRSFARWRTRTWGHLAGDGVGLEIGAGTGANFPYHPAGARVIASDISHPMLRQASEKSAHPPLVACDVEAVPFADGSFDWVAETLAFCEVADPVRGLIEVRRVLRPGGLLVMLEHVRPSGWLGRLADVATTVSAPLWGEHFDRDTAASVRAAGFQIRETERLWRDGVILLVACAP